MYKRQVYAYNNSAYYSEKVGTSTKHTVIGNSVQVSQHELEKVEIVKAFGGDVPKEKQNSEFRFIASYNGSTYEMCIRDRSRLHLISS